MLRRVVIVVLLGLLGLAASTWIRSARGPWEEKRREEARAEEVAAFEAFAAGRTEMHVEAEVTEHEPVAEEDPGWNELRDQRKSELERVPGLIAGRVLSGREPVPDAEVHLWSESAGVPPHRERWASPGVWRVRTDDGGRFRMPGMAADDYRLRVDVEGHPVTETRVKLRNAQSYEFVLIVLGTARIEGTVYDETGASVAGARVILSRRGPLSGGDGRFVHCWTDSDGLYAIDGLREGSFWLATFHTEHGGMEDDQFETWLDTGVSRLVDFGTPHVASRWRGAVVDGSGAPLPSGAVWVADTVAFAERRFLWRRDGFDELLPPGTYRVSLEVEGPNNRSHRFRAESVTIPRSGLVQDVVIGGTRLDVLIVYQGSDRSSEEVAEDVGLHFMWGPFGREDSRFPSEHSGKRLSCYGLPSERIRVSSTSGYRVGPEAQWSYEFDIPPDVPIFELELAVSR